MEDYATNRDGTITINEEKLNKLIEDKINQKTNTTIFTGNQLRNTLGNSDATVGVNRFTVTEDGKYIINYISKLNWNASSSFITWININNVRVAGNTYSNNRSIVDKNGFMNVTDIQDLKQNDIIEVRIYQYGNGTTPALGQNDLKLIKIGN